MPCCYFVCVNHVVVECLQKSNLHYKFLQIINLNGRCHFEVSWVTNVHRWVAWVTTLYSEVTSVITSIPNNLLPIIVSVIVTSCDVSSLKRQNKSQRKKYLLYSYPVWILCSVSVLCACVAGLSIAWGWTLLEEGSRVVFSTPFLCCASLGL